MKGWNRRRFCGLPIPLTRNIAHIVGGAHHGRYLPMVSSMTREMSISPR